MPAWNRLLAQFMPRLRSSCDESLFQVYWSRSKRIQLPNPGHQAFARASFDLTYQYGIVRVSGPSQAKTASAADEHERGCGIMV